ncbi:hypothetical protein EJB05_26439, partial [Eragrostis curvula]
MFRSHGVAPDAVVLAATEAVGVVKTPRRLEPVVWLTLVALALRVHATAACAASVMGFVAAFLVGLSPLASTYNAEVVPLRLCMQGASLRMTVNRVACGGEHVVHFALVLNHHARVLLCV